MHAAPDQEVEVELPRIWGLVIAVTHWAVVVVLRLAPLHSIAGQQEQRCDGEGHHPGGARHDAHCTHANHVPFVEVTTVWHTGILLPSK